MNNRAGFTLLEIMVALAIIAVIAAVVIPNFQRPGYERDQFIVRLNALVQLAWQQAIITRKVYKVTFDLSKNSAWIEAETEKKDREGEPSFERVKGLYADTTITWPVHIQVKEFLLEGQDLTKAFVGREAAKVWFYVVPDGLAQPVTITIIDKEDTLNGKPRQVGLTLNPFSAQFKVHYALQK